MKRICMAAAMAALCSVSAAAQATHLTSDPLTGLPLIPATDPSRSGAKISPEMAKYMGNAPTPMPRARICKSAYQGNFYTTTNSTLDATVAWYTSHLTGFKKTQNAAGSTIVFANGDRTAVVIVMGKPGGDTDSVAYERYQPGLSAKTIASMTQGRSIACA
jgi:hypothetical protein